MTQNRPVVIAIDGPAASGKGSLARKLADHYGFDFLDTGILYRLVAFHALEAGLGEGDIQQITEIANNLDLDSPYEDEALRSDDLGTMASKVAQIQSVRDALFDFQRHFAQKAVKGAILDGRDIGTVICPDADIKLFVTAETAERAKRRHKELQSRGISSSYASVLAEMQERDDRDSGMINKHLAKGHDAVVIDTTQLSADAVLRQAIEIIDSRLSD